MFQPIILVIIIAFEVFLGALALIKNPRSNANRFFAIMTWCMSVWSISLYLFYQPNPSALFWGRLVFAITYFTGYALLGFAIEFPSSAGISSSVYKILTRFRQIYLFVVIALSIISIFTGLILNRIEFFPWGTNFIPGPMYFTFIAHMILCTTISFVLLGVKFKRSTGIEKLQIKYLFIGLLISGVITLFTNLLWPLISGSNELSKFGPFSMIFLIGFTTYAITRYRLMDIRIVLRKTIVQVLISVFYLTIILGLIFLVAYYLGKRIPDLLLVFTGGISMTVLLLFFNPIKNYFEKVANKYFFTSLYNSQAVLENLGQELTHTLDLNQIIDSVVSTIKEAMRLDRAGVLLFDKKSNNYRVVSIIGFTAENGISLVRSNFLIEALKKKQKPIILQELAYLAEESSNKRSRSAVGKLKANMQRIEASLCLPLLIKNDLIGIIVLGNKVSKDAYTAEDLKLLESISNQASVAIQNAVSYKEVHDLSENLQERVDSQVKDIKEKNIQLEKLLMMRSKFLDTASHQLRTPVSIMKGVMEMVTSGEIKKIPPERRKMLMDGMFLKTKKLENIISDILDATEMDTEKFTLTKSITHELQVEELIQNVVTSHRLDAETKKVDLIYRKPENPLPAIAGSQKHLDQVFSNFVDNAIKYTPAKNQQTGEKGKVLISTLKDGNNIIVKISDNGIGIPQKEIKNLFDKFSRATNAKEMYTDGTGLGLFIAREIITGHHGKITVTSKLGKGTTFSVYLPIFK